MLDPSHSLLPTLLPPAHLAQVAYSLVSWLKPVLLFGTLIPYLWVATKIELDTRKFLLPVTVWNGILLGVGALAVGVALAIPIFWAGWPVMILILAGTLWAYWQWRDKRVPNHAKFQLFSADLGKKLEARKARKAQAEAILKFADAKGKHPPIPSREAPEYPIYMAVEALIAPALERRASRVEVISTGPNQPVAPSHVIDGVRYKAEALPPNVVNEAIDFVKKLAGLDLQDRRRRQSVDMKIGGPTRDALATVTTWGSNAGQSLRIDFDRVKSLQVPFDNLGLVGPQLEALKVYAEPAKRHGVVLLSAPSGQGLTTMAYGLLARHDAYTCNIKTLEKLVEAQLEGVDHSQFNPANPTVDFATNLQSILRRDPDVVYCSDVSDANAGRIAAGPGISGPLVYVGMPSDSIPIALAEWLRAVGDVKSATRCLVAVVHQRLIRKVCEACRQPLQPTPELLKRLGVPQGKTVNLFRQNGKVQVKNRIEDCPVCQGTGYFGLTGCFEVLIVDEQVREALAMNDVKNAYLAARRAGKLITVQEAAMTKVRDGVTTVDEVARVFPAAKPAPAKPAAAPGGASA